MLKFLKKYALPMIALILAIGLTIWRINYLANQLFRANQPLAESKNQQNLCLTERRGSFFAKSGDYAQ